jgi:hypothetical protein
MAFLGVASAFLWHNIGPQVSFAALVPLNSATQRTVDGVALAEQVDVLKKMISEVHESQRELRATQQQMAAKIANLEAAQQEQRTSVKNTYWYSEPKGLMDRIATQQQRSHPAAPKRPAMTRSQPDQEENIDKRNVRAASPVNLAPPLIRQLEN